MSDDDLDPRIVAALRDVPPADDGTRESHLAAALGALGTRRRSASMRVASVAAAGVVLLGAGFVAGSSRGDGGRAPAAGEALVVDESTVKGSADAVGDTCAAPGRTALGDYTDRGRVLLVVLDSDPSRIAVLDAGDCSTVAEVMLP